MQSKQQSSLAEEVLIRGAVWALVGVIFGTLFVMFAEALVGVVATPLQLVASTVGAAALTSLFYGSMRLTVLVANFTFIAMLVYTWQGPSTVDLPALVFIGAGVGVAVGAAYGLKDKASRVYCAEAKIIAGAVAGLLAGAIALLAHQLFAALPRATLAMLVAPIGVLAYVTLARWFVSHCHHLLPAVINGTLVGLGVGAVTGLVFLIMAGTLDAALLRSEALQLFAGRVESAWGPTVMACALACLPVGVVRALMRVPWYDM